LKQPQFSPLSAGEQTVITLALNAGLFDKVPLAKMPAARTALVAKARKEMKSWLGKIEKRHKLDDKEAKEILKLSREALGKYFTKDKDADAPAT
jgi:F-type H+-transporting ATPase subunit alpha